MARNENDPRIQGLGYQSRHMANGRSANNKIEESQITATEEFPEDKSMLQLSSIQMKTSRVQVFSRVHGVHCGPESKHGILECRKFAALKYDEKSKFIRKHALCYGVSKKDIQR